jgi:hypothetical protein
MIINTKKITTSGFDQDALTTSTQGEHVINFGALTTTGDLADGIFAAADQVSIFNFSSIETGGRGAHGIFALGTDIRVDNFGSVTTHGGPSAHHQFFSEGIEVDGDRFHITNFGTVHVDGQDATALAGVGADGVVANYGRIESLTDGAIVVAVGDRSQALNGGQIVASNNDNAQSMLAIGDGASAFNSGQIQMTGAGDNGMVGGTPNAHLTNTGAIQITGNGALGMAGFDVSDRIDNAGSIEVHGNAAGGIAFLGPFGGVGSNRGTIDMHGDGALAVILAGDDVHFTNSGRITTDGAAADTPLGPSTDAAAVFVVGDGSMVENTRSGNIESKNAHSAAVELNLLDPAASSELDNSGVIKGTIAVLGGDGQETVVNHGRIVGDVMLGSGDDTFVFGKGGTLTGALDPGAGHDLVRIENGAGTARITGFTAAGTSSDVVDLSAFFSSFGQVMAHSHQQGTDVVIALNHNDTLVLGHVQLSALNSADFIV